MRYCDDCKFYAPIHDRKTFWCCVPIPPWAKIAVPLSKWPEHAMAEYCSYFEEAAVDGRY